MKNLILLISLSLIILTEASSQSCLPNGITFNTQNQIDNFQFNYPNCSIIEGNVIIAGPDISNLTNLNVLTEIGGSLLIANNNLLANLSGLNNINSIAGYLKIDNNDSLSTLANLENINSINGELHITRNDNLSSLEGIDNIDAGTISNLSITYNESLLTCNVQCICDYLVNPNGVVTIIDNGIGCESAHGVANICGITLPCLPYGNYYFTAQADIDDFSINYPNCTELYGGFVQITGHNITNLNGLTGISYIEGNFLIIFNDSLYSLTGLDSLTSIGGYLSIGERYLGNPRLISLDGLEKLDTIGRYLTIGANYLLENISGLQNLKSVNGHLLINNNYELISIEGLSNLESIAGNLEITGNSSLTTLSGIDNIDANSINGISICNNDLLTTCEVNSICDFLANPNGIISIAQNETGCDSQNEVEEACETVDIENLTIGHLSDIFYPNPTNGLLHFYNNDLVNGITKLTIYNFKGQKVLHRYGITNKIDISSLGQGMYVIELVTAKTNYRQKLIIK